MLKIAKDLFDLLYPVPLILFILIHDLNHIQVVLTFILEMVELDTVLMLKYLQKVVLDICGEELHKINKKGGLKMIKTHEINLSTSIYNTLLNTNSAIIQDDEKKITENDYVLFKQVEIIDEKEQETGLYMFVKIKKSVSNHVGLKEGYIMITYDEVN